MSWGLRMSGMNCVRCDTLINDKFQSAVRSKLTGKIYYPDAPMLVRAAAVVNWQRAELALMLAKCTKESKHEDFYEFFCLECGKQLEEEKNLSTSNLIKCPDCHKPISKRASTCIHCGCPIGEITSIQPEELQPVSVDANVPKCPTCQSIKIERISTGSKVGKAALFGVFALGKISKTFKCNNCGYQW